MLMPPDRLNHKSGASNSRFGIKELKDGCLDGYNVLRKTRSHGGYGNSVIFLNYRIIPANS